MTQLSTSPSRPEVRGALAQQEIGILPFGVPLWSPEKMPQGENGAQEDGRVPGTK